MLKVVSLLSLAIIFLTGCNDSASVNEYLTLDDDQKISDVQLSASYPVPSSLEQIEREADLIVKGKVLGIQSFGEYTEEGDLTSTITEVDVLEVFEGETDSERILVAEPYRLTDEGIEPVGHYVPLEAEEEYYFFLTDSGEDIWMIHFMGFGKYHEEKEVSNQSITSFSSYEDIKAYDFLSSSEANKYSDIKEDVLSEYSK
ncbi:hypothetical protein [Alkalibacterium sp. MB6]|uniref:hypothetical protein n=1 Tax=Alkalibacterium sp. MB6 TaxID=2081965 RepID=UPI001379B141|nr:hypothetical protein [Alkalibacterium sp. MB6]